MRSSSVLLHRVEHEAFTDKDAETFKQLVRVVVQDFLPFVKMVFTNLYSEVKVEQLARCTPCALWQHAVPPSSTSSKAAVDMKMGLVVEELSEPLREVAGEVLQELELLKQRSHDVLTVGRVEGESRGKSQGAGEEGQNRETEEEEGSQKVEVEGNSQGAGKGTDGEGDGQEMPLETTTELSQELQNE